MRQAGEVLRVEVLEDPNTGRSKGCALVEFADPLGAHNAIANLQDLEVDGRPIWLREDREEGRKTPTTGKEPASLTQSPTKAASGNAKGRRVYVGNLSFNVTWQELKDVMRQAGNVIRVDILEDQETGRSKGCAIVEFARPEHAVNAIATFSDFVLDGRPIWLREDRGSNPPADLAGAGNVRLVTKDSAKDGSKPWTQVKVDNLPPGMTWHHLKDAFKQFGQVVRADVVVDHGSRAAGLVSFASPAEAVRAVEQADGAELNGVRAQVRLVQ